MPKSAVQALYHAVTGKTERFSKELDGNVVVSRADVERLHHIVIQQIEHYDVIAKPTVTIVVKTANNKVYTYSSWERFAKIKVNTTDVDVRC